MPTIGINDTTLHYERTGQGPAMLFVHGMCGDADVWADQARRFSNDHTCVRYDRRGHTRSGRGDAPISDTLHADDAAALIAAGIPVKMFGGERRNLKITTFEDLAYARELVDKGLAGFPALVR